MPKKEEIGYGMVILFVLVSLFFITLMVPFDTVTGAAVMDVSAEDLENFFFTATFPNFILLIVLSVWIVGGSLAIISQRRQAEGVLEGIPRMNRIELKEFVRESFGNGFKEEEIRCSLLSSGWDERTIEAVLRLY
ncbi:hypothetical protein COV19_03610 [Candidatus Woesearchaeota archaeon CG10_big_fil_rev_8_21_14_0_10_44_13]|nr:MAG: hypothetical protein COV19_03610 [Candidatus Woesearchaeota archaeon CG10_big_fil_rev_8_21_14_0_10_44_13]